MARRLLLFFMCVLNFDAQAGPSLEYSFETLTGTGTPSVLRSYDNVLNAELRGYAAGVGYFSGLHGQNPYLEAGHVIKLHSMMMSLKNGYQGDTFEIKQSQVSLYAGLRLGTRLSMLKPFFEGGLLLPLMFKGAIHTGFGSSNYQDEQFIKTSLGIILQNDTLPFHPYASFNVKAKQLSGHSYEGLELGINHEI